MSNTPERDMASVRKNAWSRVPFFWALRVHLTWKRQGCQPIWMRIQVESNSRSQPGFDIVGGMTFYTIDSFILEHAPDHVIEAIYGAMFAHTARFSFASRGSIYKNGNGDVTLLKSWRSALKTALEWGFAIEDLMEWVEGHKGD